MKHISVLKKEAIDGLNLKEDSIIVDATLGFGGHSSSILERINKGHLFAFDQDSEAIEYSTEFLKKFGTNFTIIKSNFVNMKEELNKRNITKVDGILFDLGVSSVQLDEGERGFSYHQDARLDMRMDKDNALDAYIVVNTYSKEDLIRIFRDYGESKYAVSIANNIVKERQNSNIETTLELAEIIKNSVPEKERRKHHPARQIFQAIRIEVNHELEYLPKAINDALDLLNVGGRVCVITFHSLEDRIVKNIFKEKTNIPDEIKGLPNIPSEYLPDYELVCKRIKPSKEEIEMNARSRSAVLRIIKRVK
jgi:16S rRNA (cytosine1402-N4)-methyltransferase